MKLLSLQVVLSNLTGMPPVTIIIGLPFLFLAGIHTGFYNNYILRLVHNFWIHCSDKNLPVYIKSSLSPTLSHPQNLKNIFIWSRLLKLCHCHKYPYRIVQCHQQRYSIKVFPSLEIGSVVIPQFS